MILYFTKSEVARYNRLLSLVSEYEKGVDCDRIFALIVKESSSANRKELDSYGPNQYIEQFCLENAIERMGFVSDISALEQLGEIVKCNKEKKYGQQHYLLFKYSEWYERRYGCKTGLLREIFAKTIPITTDNLLALMKKFDSDGN